MGDEKATVQEKANSKHQTQWAAQFAAASELCKRGYEVAFTMGNHPHKDLMVVSPDGVTFAVDVKASTKRTAGRCARNRLLPSCSTSSRSYRKMSRISFSSSRRTKPIKASKPNWQAPGRGRRLRVSLMMKKTTATTSSGISYRSTRTLGRPCPSDVSQQPVRFGYSS